MLNVIGWSRGLWTRFGIVAALVVLIPFALKRLLGLDFLTGITGVTALILLAYTIETQEMRLQLVRQNEIAIQPVLIASIERREDRTRVVLQNIGKGTALFVQAKDVIFPGEQSVVVTESFERVDYIRPGDDTVVRSRIVVQGTDGEILEGPTEGPFADPFAYHLDPKSGPRTYEVVITYEDISGARRESVMQMGKGGIRLLTHGKA